MRYFSLLLAAAALAGCSWETYRTADGSTSLRQKYETGTPVYYQDGSYSRNMNNHHLRPEQRAVKAAATQDDNRQVRGTHWQPLK